MHYLQMGFPASVRTSNSHFYEFRIPERINVKQSVSQEWSECVVCHGYNVLCGAVQYSAVQYRIAQYSTVQYSTVQYSTVQNRTIRYTCH